MKLLSIGTDRQLFESNSEVRQRQIGYAKGEDEVRIIIFAKKSLALKPIKISENVFIYPTNSSSKFGYIFDAIKIGLTLPQPDLITTQDPFECGWVGWRLARKRGSKLQLQVHTDLFNPYFQQESVLNKVRIKLARFLLPRADTVRVVSQRIADSIKNVGIKLKQASIILPVWLDLEKIKNGPIKTNLHQKYPQFKKIILMASRLTREKNIGLAIGVMPEIIKKLPHVGLVIVGSGPEEAKLKKIVADQKLDQHIVFEQWTGDLPSYYKTADLFLLTSRYEGYGRTIVEALACSCPVISTDVGVAREAGARIINDNAEEVAEAITKTL